MRKGALGRLVGVLEHSLNHSIEEPTARQRVNVET